MIDVCTQEAHLDDLTYTHTRIHKHTHSHIHTHAQAGDTGYPAVGVSPGKKRKCNLQRLMGKKL